MSFGNRLTCLALLFDLDGVLVDSRRCIELIWAKWAFGRGLDPEAIVRVAHGRRISETLREITPGLDVSTEVAILDRMEEEETGGISPVPGAAELLRGLPPDRWAIVTSGSLAVASLRIRIGAIPQPSVFITAHDVRRGKPSPEGYLIAATRLGFNPGDCVVVEDTPAGVTSGKSAGMRVIAIRGTCAPEGLSDADLVVPAFSSLRARSASSGRIIVSVAQA
jgi:sugar-phosphatase